MRRALGAVFVAALLAFLLPIAAPAAGCAPGSVQFRTERGVVRFEVTYARTAAQQARGLMGVKHMPADRGMLFLFGKPVSVSFWMHDTLIPLDMIFLDKAGRVTRVHARARPLDDTPIFGGDAVFAVLEVNGGVAERAGIVPGTLARSAAFPQADAAWRCPAH